MYILTQETRNKIEIKKSKFIAIATPIKDLSEIKAIVKKTREENIGCNHVVHAAIVGPSADLFSLSDDGEPKGTSARPALEVLKGSNITNTLVMIVRYFGGTKLGTGGLVKAYGDSVKELLKLVKTEELVKKSSFILNTSYDRYEGNKILLNKYQCDIEKEDFSINVSIRGSLKSENVSKMKKEIIEKSCARDEIIFEDIPL